MCARVRARNAARASVETTNIHFNCHQTMYPYDRTRRYKALRATSVACAGVRRRMLMLLSLPNPAHAPSTPPAHRAPPGYGTTGSTGGATTAAPAQTQLGPARRAEGARRRCCGPGAPAMMPSGSTATLISLHFNVFDTSEAARALRLPNIDLAYLCSGA